MVSAATFEAWAGAAPCPPPSMTAKSVPSRSGHTTLTSPLTTPPFRAAASTAQRRGSALGRCRATSSLPQLLQLVALPPFHHDDGRPRTHFGRKLEFIHEATRSRQAQPESV